MSTRKQKTESRKASRNKWGNTTQSTPIAKIRELNELLRERQIARYPAIVLSTEDQVVVDNIVNRSRLEITRLALAAAETVPYKLFISPPTD